MKNYIKRLSVLVLMLAVIANTAGAQKSEKTTVKNLIESRNFSFVAQSVLPMSGAVRQLTTEYDMTVSGDKIDTYLPYFGVAYVAPIDPTQGGINFTSRNFTYIPKTTRRGWQILIKPNDANDVREMILDVSTKGYATLQVINNNRQPISYQGYVTDPRRK